MGVSPVEVVVVGSINEDLVVRVPALPAPGETVLGSDLLRFGGGKGANAAVAAARSGACTVLVGAVGTDDFGDRALAELNREGVDLSFVTRREEPTGVALILVSEDGESQIAVAPGANGALEPEQVAATLRSLLVSASACLVSLEIPDAVVEAAALTAGAGGVRCILNPAPARPLSERVLAARPLLTPNAGEAAELAGRSDPEAAARALADLTGAPVIVTLGEDGALVLRDGKTQIAAPPRDIQVVDATGAGDVFNGCLGARLAAGDDLVRAVELAVLAASRSTEHPGARGGMEALAEILRADVESRRSE